MGTHGTKRGQKVKMFALEKRPSSLRVPVKRRVDKNPDRVALESQKLETELASVAGLETSALPSHYMHVKVVGYGVLVLPEA